MVQDIEARAEMLKQPLPQYLWGEMLNYGICVKANPPRWMALLRGSVTHGSTDAMVRTAEYYYHGTFVFQDKERAVHYFYQLRQVVISQPPYVVSKTVW